MPDPSACMCSGRRSAALWAATLLCVLALAGVVAAARPVQAADRAHPAGDWEEGPPPALADQIARAFVIVAVGVVLTVALLLLFEDRFIFHPTNQPVAGWQAEGLGVTECNFRARDGTRLHGWWHPGEGLGDPAGRPVLLWFHGNAGNITHRADDLRALAELGLAVFMFDYRGYGRSEGRASEVGLYLDGEAAHRHLTDVLEVAPERIVCFGRSLGAAVALHVALRARPAGLIMESPFQSIGAMARRRSVLRLLVPLLRNRFDNMDKVRRLKVPLLVVHGAEDELVPLAQGRAVFAEAQGAKEFLLVDGAGHNDMLQVGGRSYCDRIVEFCRRCVAERRAARSA